MSYHIIADHLLSNLDLELSEDDWDALIRENLKSVFLCTKAVGKITVEQRKESIINIASVAGLGAVPRVPAYAAAKAGVINLPHTLVIEGGPKIRV